MGTLCNSEDPDGSPGSVLFAQKKVQYFYLKIITCDPSIYTMDNPDFIVCNIMENSIGLKMVSVQLVV